VSTFRIRFLFNQLKLISSWEKNNIRNPPRTTNPIYYCFHFLKNKNHIFCFQKFNWITLINGIACLTCSEETWQYLSSITQVLRKNKLEVLQTLLRMWTQKKIWHNCVFHVTTRILGVLFNQNFAHVTNVCQNWQVCVFHVSKETWEH